MAGRSDATGVRGTSVHGRAVDSGNEIMKRALALAEPLPSSAAYSFKHTSLRFDHRRVQRKHAAVRKSRRLGDGLDSARAIRIAGLGQ